MVFNKFFIFFSDKLMYIRVLWISDVHDYDRHDVLLSDVHLDDLLRGHDDHVHHHHAKIIIYKVRKNYRILMSLMSSMSSSMSSSVMSSMLKELYKKFEKITCPPYGISC